MIHLTSKFSKQFSNIKFLIPDERIGLCLVLKKSDLPKVCANFEVNTLLSPYSSTFREN